jgi:peptidoglycan hydrolase-like protein with peptidoglycan-binding domain
MELWYPNAKRKPLGPQTQRKIMPRIFVVHTIVGSLRGTDAMFRRQGFTGVESTFGLGGPGDNDGELWQWQQLNYSADAQGDGNGYCTSVETADAGNPARPWSRKQLDSLVDLGFWWARQVGAPGRLVTGTSQKGFGYHRQFLAWNKHNHSCPGDVRLRQYKGIVLPRIAARMSGERAEKTVARSKPVIATAKPVLTRMLSHGDNGADVRLVQHLVGVVLDNDFGDRTEAGVKAWQRIKKLTPDGVFGPASCRAAGWLWKG